MHPLIESLGREGSMISDLQDDQPRPDARQRERHHDQEHDETTGGRAPHSPAPAVEADEPGTWRITTSPGAGCTSP